eukprot:m.45498 g.45498  ORF g.45498 m.45498 type:complete len:54 (-) comp10671_c0_seq2:55-216(-)
MKLLQLMRNVLTGTTLLLLSTPSLSLTQSQKVRVTYYYRYRTNNEYVTIEEMK